MKNTLTKYLLIDSKYKFSGRPCNFKYVLPKMINIHSYIKINYLFLPRLNYLIDETNDNFQIIFISYPLTINVNIPHQNFTPLSLVDYINTVVNNVYNFKAIYNQNTYKIEFYCDIQFRLNFGTSGFYNLVNLEKKQYIGMDPINGNSYKMTTGLIKNNYNINKFLTNKFSDSNYLSYLNIDNTNNNLQFNFTQKDININIPSGSYGYNDIINIINSQLNFNHTQAIYDSINNNINFVSDYQFDLNLMNSDFYKILGLNNLKYSTSKVIDTNYKNTSYGIKKIDLGILNQNNKIYLLNIDETNNKFEIKFSLSIFKIDIIIPTSAYSISDLVVYLNSEFQRILTSANYDTFQLSCWYNANYNRLEFKSKRNFTLDLTQSNFNQFLGLNKQIYTSNQYDLYYIYSNNIVYTSHIYNFVINENNNKLKISYIDGKVDNFIIDIGFYDELKLINYINDRASNYLRIGYSEYNNVDKLSFVCDIAFNVDFTVSNLYQYIGGENKILYSYNEYYSISSNHIVYNAKDYLFFIDNTNNYLKFNIANSNIDINISNKVYKPLELVNYINDYINLTYNRYELNVKYNDIDKKLEFYANSSFEIDFSISEFHKIVSLDRIKYNSINETGFLIDDSNKDFKLGFNNIYSNITIPNGFYSLTTLISSINQLINLLNDTNFKYNNETNKIDITSNLPFSFDFKVSNFYQIIGLDKIVYNNDKNNFKFITNSINFNRPKYININLANISNDVMMGSNNNNQINFICPILKGNFGDIIEYNNQIFDVKMSVNNIKLDHLDIIITDDINNYFINNDTDFFMVLEYNELINNC